MKKTIAAIVAIVMLTTINSTAQQETSMVSITAKQGFVMTWNDATAKNLTTFETIRTRPVDGIGRWNALVEGWTLDAGFGWDANSTSNGALMLGRKFGTLGTYFPFLDFPLLGKLDITIYPFGLYIENLTDHPKLHGCSGGAIISATIKFG